MNTKSLYTLSKYELVEMVRDFYRDEREKTKYLNVRTKAQLIQMLEERLKYPPIAPRPVYVPPPTPHSSSTYMNDMFIQSKYASFLKRLHEDDEKDEDKKSTKSS